MQNQNVPAVTQQQTTSITTSKPQSIGSWFLCALPKAMCEVLGEQKKVISKDLADMGLRALTYAAVSHGVNSLQYVMDLPPILQADAVAHLAIRTSFSLLENAREQGQIDLLRGSYEVGIDNLIDTLALAYYGVSMRNTENGDQLHAIVADTLRNDYAALSPMELKEAFARASKAGQIKAYGKFTVQLLHDVLGGYMKQRNQALSVLLDKQQQIEQQQTNAEQIATKNNIAYQQAVEQYYALRDKNTQYENFYQCPHHFVRRLVDDNHIILDKKASVLLKYARGFAAYDIVIDAPTRAKQLQAKKMLDLLNISGITSPRINMPSHVVKILGIASFDYENCTPKSFQQTVEIYLAKIIFFKAIKKFENGR